MDHLLKILKCYRKSSEKKTRFKQLKGQDVALSIDSLPFEIIEDILSNLSNLDLLQCRLVNSSLRKAVDRQCAKKFVLTLKDETFIKCPINPLYLKFDTLIIRKLCTTVISNIFVSQNFETVKFLEFTDTITLNNFQQLVTKIQNLQIIRLNSLALGGNELQSASFTTTKASQAKKKLSNLQPPKLMLKEIHLTIDFVPVTHKGFSSQCLITNLRAIQQWNTPTLHTITFSVQSSTFSEQFYFTLDSLLYCIPFSCYGSLNSLRIRSPKIQPTKSNQKQNERLQEIQLKHLELRIPNYKHCISSGFMKFLTSQHNLESIFLDVQNQNPSSLEQLLTTIKNNNPLLLRIN